MHQRDSWNFAKNTKVEVDHQESFKLVRLVTTEDFSSHLNNKAKQISFYNTVFLQLHLIAKFQDTALFWRSC